MTGFGIALLLFAAIAFYVYTQLRGGGGDLFPLIELPPLMAAIILGIVGGLCVLIGVYK